MRWTNENLKEHALQPVMQWLIWAARNQSTITYGQAAELLLDEGFDDIRRFAAQRVGNVVAGGIMEKIGLHSGVPPLNVLLVSQTQLPQETQLPSIGVCRDLAIWHDGNQERENEYAKIARENSNRWRTMCLQAMSAVYAYPKWNEVFENVWKQDYPEQNNPELIPVMNPQEPDGLNFPGGGEGEGHRRLREWVMTHPEAVDEQYARRPTATEVMLKSGDRVDVVIYLSDKLSDKTVAVEVKSRVSNEADLERGVYQCIKYKAIMDAMDMNAEAVLVTESGLPERLQSFAHDHHVTHVQIERQGEDFRIGTHSRARRGTSPETVFGMLSRPEIPRVSVEELSESAASGWAGEA